MSKFVAIFISLYFFNTNLAGQEVTLGGVGFLPYETYYISSIDLSTGESSVQLFKFLISPPPFYDSEKESPIEFNLQFKIEILSPELGFSEKTTLLEMKTSDKISMEAAFRLDNRDFNLNNSQIYYINGEVVKNINGNNIKFELGESLSNEKLEDLLGVIVTVGRLPNGIYDFTLKLSEFSNGQSDIIKNKPIIITTPTTLNLIYPGGALIDTAQNLVYTPYPVFQWSTETCLTCGLFIRVAEFNPESHSSVEEAIEDLTNLPLDQTSGWEAVEIGTSFQYPVIGSRDLQAGKLYAWQIKKELPTTLGIDAYLSPISIFKLADPSASQNIFGSGGAQSLSVPVLIALKDLLGTENFNTYFGNDGDLTSYLPSGTYQINNESAVSSDILQIIDQLQKGTISVVNISIE